MESCRTESRCERCFTVLSCRIVDGVVSCGLTIDVSGGRIESGCARSPQDIRSKRKKQKYFAIVAKIIMLPVKKSSHIPGGSSHRENRNWSAPAADRIGYVENTCLC